MCGVDARAVLGIGPDASPEEAHVAYRRAAKRWHPDRAGDTAEAERRMAELNAAYAAVRDGTEEPPTVAEAAAAGARRAAGAQAPVRAGWLPERVRRRIGGELRAALERDEPVEEVLPCATWASPATLLLMTDRRLLWLQDDSISGRVRSLRWRDVEHVHVRPRRLLRRRAALTIGTARGKDVTFAELRPEDARRLGVLVARAAGLPPARRVA